jgi:hypothetical protein
MRVGNNVGMQGVMGKSPSTRYGVTAPASAFSKNMTAYKGNIKSKGGMAFRPKAYSTWGWHA